MSLIPMRSLVCGPAKGREGPRDMAGTTNARLGHRLRGGGKNYRLEKQHPKEVVEDDPQEVRMRTRSIGMEDFKKETDRKIRCKMVHQRVREGMAQYEEKLDARRERLRDLLRSEETALTKEIADLASREAESRIEESRARAEEVSRVREEQRTALAAAKRMQQYLARCPEVRQNISKKNAKDAKHCNLMQMAENQAKKEAERELECLWHELMLKEIEAKKAREIEETKKRSFVGRETANTLAKQVAGKLALEERRKQVEAEEKEYLERLWENVRQEELKNLERERRRRDTLKKDLEEQIFQAKKFLAERAREEETFDRMLRTLAEEEIAREKTAKIKETEDLRREILAYLRYLEELREEEARRNIEVDAIIEQSFKDSQARRDLAIRRYKEERARGLQEVLRGREEQLNEKRKMLESEKRKFEEERMTLEREIELQAKLTERQQRECKERALQYGKDLMKQHVYVETVKKREAEEQERTYREELRKEEEFQKLTEELLRASENITPHPFKALLQEFAERRAAEKQGRCYSPPPLPPKYI